MIVDKNSPVSNTLAAPSVASFTASIHSKEDLVEANRLAKIANLPLLPLGEGSNIAPKQKINAFVAVMSNEGITQGENLLTVQAGEKWDNVVRFAVDKGLSGLESLSWIPGLAGAAPVQNIGAYGTEISNVVKQVEVFDTKTEKFEFIKNENCEFEYRNSIFKKNIGRFVVTSVILQLSYQKPKIPDYKDVKAYFLENNIANPSLSEIRNAIICIRKNKLPDPREIPNAGSFFTNPILEKSQFDIIKNKFPDIPSFPNGDKVKVPAGWLIEKAGLKGKEVGKLKIYEKNALVLTNPDRRNFEEIQSAENIIKNIVYQKFGILLVREPIVI